MTRHHLDKGFHKVRYCLLYIGNLRSGVPKTVEVALFADEVYLTCSHHKKTSHREGAITCGKRQQLPTVLPGPSVHLSIEH